MGMFYLVSLFSFFLHCKSCEKIDRVCSVGGSNALRNIITFVVTK